MHDDEGAVAGADELSVCEWRPGARVVVDHKLARVEAWPSRAQRGHSARMIGMPVRDDDSRKRPTGQGSSEALDVPLGADTGVNERGLGSLEEVCVIAGAGHRRRIQGQEQAAHERSQPTSDL